MTDSNAEQEILDKEVEYRAFAVHVAQGLFEKLGAKFVSFNWKSHSTIEIPTPLHSINNNQLGELMFKLARLKGALSLLGSEFETNVKVALQELNETRAKVFELLDNDVAWAKRQVSDKKQLVESNASVVEARKHLLYQESILLRIRAYENDADLQHKSLSRELTSRGIPNAG